LNLKP